MGKGENHTFSQRFTFNEKCFLLVLECDPSKCEPVEQSQTCREDQTLIAARVEGTCCISYICGMIASLNVTVHVSI